jgi:hypothetical protein
VPFPAPFPDLEFQRPKIVDAIDFVTRVKRDGLLLGTFASTFRRRFGDILIVR